MSPTFRGFTSRKIKYGAEEAKRAFALEHHNIEALLKIIKAEGWEDSIDLVSSLRVNIVGSEVESRDAKTDFDDAIAAGMELDNVEWLTKEDVQTVRCYFRSL